MQVIQDLAENVRDEGNASKKLVNESIREYTEVAVWLLPIYIHDRQICEAAFAYFNVILDVLKSQMGADSVENIIQAVVTLFSKDQLTETIRNRCGEANISSSENLAFNPPCFAAQKDRRG